MNRMFFLALLSSAVALAEAPLEKLPKPEKPDIFGCRADLVGMSKKNKENMAKILFCIDRNYGGVVEKEKIRDPNFVKAAINNFDAGRSSGSLAYCLTLYEGGKKYLERLSELRDYVENNNKKGDSKSNSKPQTKKEEAVHAMIESFADANTGDLSGVLLPHQTEESGSERVGDFEADFHVELFGEKIATPALIKNPKIQDYGNFNKLANDFAKAPETIPEHPKFLDAMRMCLNDFWVKPETLSQFSHLGQDAVIKMIQKWRHILGAYSVYKQTLTGDADIRLENSQESFSMSGSFESEGEDAEPSKPSKEKEKSDKKTKKINDDDL